MLKTLVIEPDFFVAEDISEIVQGLYPCAEIDVRPTVETATNALAANLSWDLVIVSSELLGQPDSIIRSLLERSEALKVLLNASSAVTALTRGWRTIAVPFSENTLAHALAEISRTPNCRCA